MGQSNMSVNQDRTLQDFEAWVEMGMLDFAVQAAMRAGNEPTFVFSVQGAAQGNEFMLLDDAIEFARSLSKLTKADVRIQALLRKNGIIVFESTVRF